MVSGTRIIAGIGYLTMQREKDALQQLDVVSLSENVGLIRQVQQSHEDRENGRIYGQETGLEYLRSKVKEIEREQSL